MARSTQDSRAVESLADMEATSPQQMASVEYSDLCAALAKLAPKPCEALMLVAASGFSYGEAASLCGCPVGTVKSRVNRRRNCMTISIDARSESVCALVGSAGSARRAPADADGEPKDIASTYPSRVSILG
jgi:RNA polymerase sigma-70 factor (ECF subfamily)